VQTTLLGLAIAMILALVTALAGPLFVDWNKYRDEFETRASQLTGLQLRVAGPVDARLLPTPTLTLQRIDVSRPGEAGAVRARKLAIEFSLSSLMRGEFRATDLRVEGAEFALGLDASGRLDWPAPSIGFDPDALSIERLDILDSRAMLTDSASGSGLVLDKLEFRGELRSLAGPIKGEGAFLLDGQHYPYRLSASRVGDDGAVRVRFGIDPIDRPLLAEADASVWIERGIPRFEGTLNLARPVGRAPAGAQALIIEPWRVSSKIRGDSAAAVLEQIEFQYGPDDRAMKLKGDARLTFGSQPEVEGVLSSTQLDLDRLLALPEATRRRPLPVIKALAEYFAGAPRLPIPARLGISAESVTLAGATLQRVSGDLKSDGESWDIESLELRAPGAAQIRLSGRVGVTRQGVTFAGPAQLDAKDPRGLVAWLTDRAEAPAASGPFRAEADVTLGSDGIAVDRLKAEVDRMSLDGSLAYSAGVNGDSRPRIQAVLNAPEINLDRVLTLVQGVFGDAGLEWPREGALALKIGLASFGGVEAKRADVDMQFDGNGLEIRRFSLGDLGGAAVAVKGRIDTSTSYPRGAITLELDARTLDGVVMVLDKFAPHSADELRRRAASLAPAKLIASLSVTSERATAVAFKLDGNAAGLRIDVHGDAGTARDAFTLANLSKLLAANVNLGGRLDAADGGALVELLGLHKLVAVDRRPGWLNLSVTGPLDGDMTVDGQLTAGGLNLSAKGNIRPTGSQAPSAGFDLKLAGANVRSPRPAEILPAALTARLDWAEGTIRLSRLNGTLAGSDIRGQLTIGFGQPTSLDGAIEIGAFSLPAVIAAAIGVPAQSGSANVWPADPFDAGLLGSLRGQIKVKSAQVALTPTLSARNLEGVFRFDHSDLTFEEIDGTLADGRISGGLTLRRGPDGLSARSHIGLASANIGELLPTSGAPLSGQLTLNLDLAGTGRSALALIGSLQGSGTFTLQDGRIAALNPAAFDAIIRNVDQGLPIDAIRIRDRMELALGNGALNVRLAEGEIAVTAGQARLGNAMVRAEQADVTLAANVNLGEAAVDAKLMLSGPAGAGGASQGRPEIGIMLKGPIAAPKRTLDVAALASWLALRAVEQQAKRLDALESGREVPVEPAAPAAPVPPAAKPSEAPAPTVAPRPVRTMPGVPARPPRSRPAAPAQSAAPPLSPPIDIRPQLVPRFLQPTVPRGSSSLQNSVGP